MATVPDFSNLKRATDDVLLAANDTDAGPADERDFAKLRTRLTTARLKLPPLYRDAVYDPFVAELDRLGDAGYKEVLASDPNNESSGRLMLDIAQAILQQAENFSQSATDAYQEVISDLYDGFLSAEDRRGVKKPDRSVVPPLVKWGEPASGPYTWPAEATESFNLKTGIVSMPPAHARHGLLAWAALGHETAGHDIMGADIGLAAEMQDVVFAALKKAKMGDSVAEYWSTRIDETASDVMGILNIGPAAAIGLIGFLRGFVGGALRNSGPQDDPHPADIVRGYLGAETVRLLNFTGRSAWANAITAETNHDLQTISLAGSTLTSAVARKSAAVVAKALVRTKLASLENHALGEIQNWADADETIAQSLKASILTGSAAPANTMAGAYAAHSVAAGVYASIGASGKTGDIFARTLAILKSMHDHNASWGPLFVAHPGSMVRDLAIIR